MALSTWVARFVVDHGRVTEEGGRLRSFQRRRLDEPDVDLVVLHEPGSPKGEELGSQALDAIGRLFLQDRLSLTGALTRSLKDTHQTLLDWNRRSVPRDQVALGVTAALVGDNIVYLAQAGPTSVFLRHGNSLSRLEPTDLAAQALGEGEMEPSVRRLELGSGDLVLASSAHLLELMGEDVLRDLLRRPVEEILPELYLLTRDLPNFALFLVSCAETEETGEAGEEGQRTERTATPEQKEPERRSEASVQGVVPSPATAREGTPTALSSGVSRNGNGASTDALDPSPALVQPRPVDISRTVVNLRNDRATGRNEYARTTSVQRPFRVNFSDWRLLQIAAALGVVLIMIVFVPGLVRQNRTDKLASLIQNAQVNLAASKTEQDPGQKRFYLEETRRLTTEALRIDDANVTANDLRTEASVALQTMDAVLNISPLTSVATLSRTITGDISITGMTVQADAAYLLDSAGGRVISVPLGGGSVTPTVVFQAGETYGDTPAKKAAQLVWDGTPTEGRLLILDQERKLFELKPGSRPVPLPLRKTSTWSSVAGLATYDGNLYVLDPTGSQVHRYLPAAQGFDSEPNALLSRQTNLTDSVGFAVDGDIFVIYKNGKVGRFSNGEAKPFNLGGIDRPISAAIDIDVVPSTSEVYIADSGNKRIVVAGKDGNFHRQLTSVEITDLRSIGIDPSGAQLYLVIGDQLMTAPIVR